ncbi:DNA segregation ATPase, FtsK/SpoIIIE family [Terriglobus roseus DSM 18391]|uniref:DNA segregation ATPase, FtsK/SpoIIIE family n=1 Tax=Terriglobus roseus (strain DSM 18391 / NRRL B-41598 / KBS 63) TaxID=926566 RepID=I3ZJW7_TERRK|nr:DNA translocase FtsK [Terriglobus roseus]AFL89535.1 DNA segregation ATPase, FtsK/SpoIIIE family [Terriglobus roseus DSM 18391]
MKPLRLEMTPTRSRRLNEVLGLGMLTLAVLLLLSLISYTPGDPSLNTVGGLTGPGVLRPVHNWAGRLGASVSDILLQVIGIASLIFPLMIGRLGVCWLRSRPQGSPAAKSIGLVLWILAAPAALALFPIHMLWRSALPIEGVTGRFIADAAIALLNFPGACVVICIALLLSVYLSTTFTFNTAQDWAGQRLGFAYRARERYIAWRGNRGDLKSARAANRLETRRERMVAKQDAENARTAAAAQRAASGSLIAGLFAKWGFWRKGIRPDTAIIDERPVSRSMWSQMPRTDVDAGPEPEFAPLPGHLQAAAEAHLMHEGAIATGVLSNTMDAPLHTAAQENFSDWNQPAPAITESDPFDWIQREAPPAPARTGRTAEVVPFPVSATRVEAAAPPPPPANTISFGKRADDSLKTVTLTTKSVHGYKLPPSSLLYRSEEHATVREEALREEAKVLVEKCGEFGVDGQVTQINPGPVVTTFEFRPDAGVKYSRVTGLADDLCLAMAAESILIERMAGKSTVGIQVPNHERETIWLRDVVESEGFANSRSKVEMAMGKDINGRIVTANLAAMPHVLIAGSTGSGKSVAINAMIMSVLFKATPEEVRMILVDPKRVELGMYEGIPHLFTPIITEPKLAANALKNAVREMERRLKLLASRHVRNLDQYNKLFESGQLFNEDGEEQQPLPYIMIIIDELADLMMLDKANVEESITRLAQMARAVGIHLVLATQRPSVDVITGLIKANVPTRMSFRLATKVDSRTIIDSNGAESLLGRGDMLFLPPGTSRLQRVHAPFVTEKEISDVVAFWKAQGEAEYVEGFLEGPKDDKGNDLGEDGENNNNDELFDDAVRLVYEFGKASTSLLQRRLRIGYGRAASLIDMMERDGLVGPADGSRPREILKSQDFYREVDEAVR